MFIGEKAIKPVAVILLLLLVLTVSGLLIYYLWFFQIPGPPQRSRPVLGTVAKLIVKGGNNYA